jgi:four helix bundle protein
MESVKENQKGPRDIGERSLDYSVRAVRLFRSLVKLKDEAARVIGRQYLRSATSVGANIGEAHFAESRADFIHKLRIARKEARESLYWLRILVESGVIARTVGASDEGDGRADCDRHDDHFEYGKIRQQFSP